MELENISQMEYLLILEKGNYLRNIISGCFVHWYGCIALRSWAALGYSFIQRYNELTILFHENFRI